jgi:hypothetical protein
VTRIARLTAALFFLFLSYYLIKPLRTSQFLREFSPQTLPAIYLVVSLLSWLLTKGFQAAAARLSRTWLVTLTFGLTMLVQGAFAWAIPRGGQATTAAFYLWSSVYFLLLASTFWGVLNERFSPIQAQKNFASVALGATLGNIAGAFLADLLAHYQWRSGCLLWSALALGLSLILLLPELRYPKLDKPLALASRPESTWLQHLPLRALALMVIGLAVFSTTLDFLTQKRLDEQLGRETYVAVMGSHWPEGHQEFKSLRSQPPTVDDWRQLSQSSGLSVGQLQRSFEDYRDRLELSIRGLYARIFWIQGLCGLFSLAVLCRPLVLRLGLRRSLLVLPTTIILVLPLLALPLEVWAIEFLLILMGTLNYSLNNPLKEMLYSHCDSQATITAKPIIEGPCMRLGDVLCALVGLLLVALGWRAELSLVLVGGLVLLWWGALHRLEFAEAGGVVDSQQAGTHDLSDHGQLPKATPGLGQGAQPAEPDHGGLQAEAEQGIDG